MGNQAGIIIRNVKNELFHSAKRLILNEVKGIECLRKNNHKSIFHGFDDFLRHVMSLRSNLYTIHLSVNI